MPHPTTLNETVTSPFQARLAQEIHRSECLGLGLVAGLLLLGLLAVLGKLAFEPMDMAWQLRGWNIYIWLALVVGIAALLEGTMWWLCAQRLAAQQPMPGGLRYLSALLEISLPSVAILLYANVFEAVYALTVPAVLGYFVIISLSTLRLDPRLCVLLGVVAALQYAAIAFFCLWGTHPMIQPTPLNYIPFHVAKVLLLLVGGVVAGLVTHRIRQSIVSSLQSGEEHERIFRLFGQHVSPQVVNKLLAQPGGLSTEIRHVCVLFLDIRGFTSFSESRDPEQIISYLNDLFDFMTDIINRHDGIINKFLGDGFMAVFGAPFPGSDHSLNAVNAALDLCATLKARIAQAQVPCTRIGIGLHTGSVVTGNVGSHSRKEYTLIGDVVNLAARIESLNKQFNSSILASKEVWDAVHTHYPEAQSLGAVTVKGRTKPVALYQFG